MEKSAVPISTIFGRTNRLINDALEASFKQHALNMSVIEFALLFRLSTIDEDEITQQHFAQMEGKHKSVILRQVDAMEQKRWVSRITDTADKRKSMISITKTGMSVLGKALAMENEMMQQLTAGIKADDIAIFTRVGLQLQTRLATLNKSLIAEQ